MGTFPPWGRQAYRLLKGALSFLVLQKRFYGPQRRKMMFMGFVRLGVWYNFFRARNGGFSGNLEGEGFILGGVFVVGSGKQVNSSCSRMDLWVSVVCWCRTPIWGWHSLFRVLQPFFHKARRYEEGEGRGVTVYHTSAHKPPHTRISSLITVMS